MADKLIRNQAYFIAREYVQNKPVAWDHLNGTNDLWNYIKDDMTRPEVLGAAQKAYEDRVKEDSGDIQIEPKS